MDLRFLADPGLNISSAQVASLLPSADFSAQIDADYSYDASTPYYVQLLNKSATAYPLAPLVRVEPGRVGTTDVLQQKQVAVYDGRALIHLTGQETYNWAYHGPDKYRLPREIDPRDYLFIYFAEPLSKCRR